MRVFKPRNFLLFNIDFSKPQKSLIKTSTMTLSTPTCSVFRQIIPGNIDPQIALLSCNPRQCTPVHIDLKALLVINNYIKLIFLCIILSLAPHLHPTRNFAPPSLIRAIVSLREGLFILDTYFDSMCIGMGVHFSIEKVPV